MDSALVSTKPWPIVIVSMPPVADAPTLETLFRGLEEVFRRRERFASLIDLTDASSLPGAYERKRIAAWQKEFEGFQARYNVGSAHVVRSAPIRGALTALRWLFVPPTPQTYVGDRISAFDWCLERCEERGLEISPACRGYRSVLVESEAPQRAEGS